MDGCANCDVDHPRGAPDCPARRIGQTVGGRYRIERLVGVGGMGAVYEAIHIELGTKVALKTIQSRVPPPAETVERFRREARELAALRHPGIVEVRDFGRDEAGAPFMVMELLEGDSVADLVAQGPLPIDQAARIAIDALDALAEAHAKNLVHRDLKPANLFLSRARGSETLKILDFGIAKVIGDAQATTLTRTGLLIGSAPYMSPEQAQDPRGIDPRSDVYAMGATLFELLTGRLSVEGTTSVEIVVRIAKGEVLRHPRQIRAQVPVWLDEVVAKALTTDPAARYQSALEMKRALEHGLRGATLPGAALEPPTGPATTPAPSSRDPDLAATAVAPMIIPTGAHSPGPARSTRPSEPPPAVASARPAPTAAPVELAAAPPPARRSWRMLAIAAFAVAAIAVVVVMSRPAGGGHAVVAAPPQPTQAPPDPAPPVAPAPLPPPPAPHPTDVAPADAGKRGRVKGTTHHPPPTPPVADGGAPEEAAAPPPAPPPEDLDEPLWPVTEAGLPPMPDRTELLRILFDARADVTRCAPGVMILTQFQIAGSTGRARQIRLERFEGTPEQGRCIKQAIRRIPFPRFARLTFPVQHVFPR